MTVIQNDTKDRGSYDVAGVTGPVVIDGETVFDSYTSDGWVVDRSTLVGGSRVDDTWTGDGPTYGLRIHGRTTDELFTVGRGWDSPERQWWT